MIRMLVSSSIILPLFLFKEIMSDNRSGGAAT